MKKIALFLLPLLLAACASQKDSAALLNGAHVIESPCPPKGNCILTVYKDKGLVIKTDDIGQMYYERTDKPGATVVTHTYTKTRKTEYQDDFYSEEIAFESDAQLSGFKDGKKTDIYFKVTCFCRGKAGTYKVEGGDVTVKDNRLRITLPEIVDNQLTKEVTVSFK